MLIQIQLLPGTSGEFIIEIDATGTETLLTYDIKITFTNKPANLKFYEDIEKTQELIVENDKYLALNGFMSLDDNKKRDIPIYWDWKFETGESEMDREENDIIDSEFMGKVMSMQIDVNGTQVTSNPYEEGVAFSTINGKIIATGIHGIRNSKGTVKFYDGKIESAGKLIYGLTPEIPEGYKLIQGEKEIIDGVEYLTSYLEKQ